MSQVCVNTLIKDLFAVIRGAQSEEVEDGTSAKSLHHLKHARRVPRQANC
jgi:hypothetical protein